MKKTCMLALAASVCAFTGASAQTALVAGWDFSSYLGSNFSTVTLDVTPVNTLSANYSSFDPTFGAGAQSAAFGTLFYNGQFGSDLQNTDFSTDTIVPTTGNLVSNAPAFGQSFNLNTVQEAEGADFAKTLSLLLGGANSTTSGFKVVFGAFAPGLQTDWVFTFGGIDVDDSTLSVEFSTDGINYAAAETFSLNAVDTAYSTTFKAVSSDTAYFRVSSDDTFSIIDNVAIGATAVPEPSTFAALAGALALGFVAVRRRRA